jgi:hypothetical protein
MGESKTPVLHAAQAFLYPICTGQRPNLPVQRDELGVDGERIRTWAMRMRSLSPSKSFAYPLGNRSAGRLVAERAAGRVVLVGFFLAVTAQCSRPERRRPLLQRPGVADARTEDSRDLALEALERLRISVGGPHQRGGLTRRAVDLGLGVQEKHHQRPDDVVHLHLGARPKASEFNRR